MKNYLYWFEDSELLCKRCEDGSFFVLNGEWGFRIVGGRCIINEGWLTEFNDYDLGAIEKPKALTREQFDKMMPNFGY